MMARARSSCLPAMFLMFCFCLPAMFLMFCFYFCSISSIHVHSAVSQSLDLDFSHPTAILIFPEPASITVSARPGRSRAHSTGRVSYAKRVSPWESPTGEMISFATNFSFQIIPGLHSSSCAGDAMSFYFAPTMPHGHGQKNLGFLLSQNCTADWYEHRFACFSLETEDRSSRLIAIDVRSMEDTATTLPSKNISSALLSRVRVSYLASHAAALSFNCSGSCHHHDKFLWINTTELCDPVFCVFLQEQQKVYLASLLVHWEVWDFTTLHVAESHEELHFTWMVSHEEVEESRVPSRRRYRRRYHRLPYEPRARRLMSGSTHGRRATRKQRVATRGKAVSSWLEQAAVAASALVGLICAVAAVLLCCMRSKRTRQSTWSIELEDAEHMTIRAAELRRGLGPREFRYSELAAATDNFAEERKIGRGGFGPVYRGYLTDQDRHVAIKMLSGEQSAQGLKEFQAEVTVMNQLRHRNIVHLVGWCGRRRELALVYELMPGGSLDTHLYNPDRTITWSERYKIALGLGSALRYLHTECDQRVVHGDIKPANVMLDASRNAKLGDFGLARLVDHGAEPQTTQVVAGTVGYIDPELVNSRRPSAESDVYSFGVVLLEITCGRRPASRGSGQASAALLASVRDMYRRNLILDAADRRLGGEFDRLQMERLLVTGLWCAHHDPMRRPSVAQAIDVLRSEDAKLPVLEAVRGSGEIHSLEGQAYGDLSAEDSAYLHETAYLTSFED